MPETVPQERGVEYLDTDTPVNYAAESTGNAPNYPAQTRTYTVSTANWDQTRDYTASGLSTTLTSWTRTELHN